MENQETKCRELLDKILKNESVCRWTIYRNRKLLRSIIQEEEHYHDIEHELESIIDTVNDSL